MLRSSVYSFCILIVVGFLIGCRRAVLPSPAPLVVRCVTAEEADESRAGTRAAYIGSIRGDEELTLSLKVAGIVERIGPPDDSGDWQEGAEVRAGTLLAQLKPGDFTNAIASARAERDLARKAFERGKELVKNVAISQQEFDALLADQASKEAKLAEREQEFQNSKIVAAFPGTILARFVRSGENVLAGHPVLRFASLARMSIELGVPDRVVGALKVGQKLKFQVPALRDREFEGDISEVGVAAREGARLFKVILKVDNPDQALKSGMTAQVMLEERPGLPGRMVLVPLSALVAQAGGQLAVFVIDGAGIAHERAVKTGDIIRSSVIVTEGVRSREKVVVTGAPSLYDGARVSAQPQVAL